jgi:hypothetical protein
MLKNNALKAALQLARYMLEVRSENRKVELAHGKLSINH